MRIATWNINSVRLRIQQVLRFIKEQNIDVMCLQETKTQDEFFPSADFLKIGMKYQYFRGEKSYNGVAIISNTQLTDLNYINFCKKGDSRHISVKFKNDIELHNFYVPAGGDEPDITINPKFEHKISFLNEMKSNFLKDKKTNKILVGDLNIAPLEHDVWSHKQLLNVVSHTKIETEKLLEIVNTGEWVDVMRELVSHDSKLYSWWSYRNRNWEISNRGRRLDHLWVSKNLFSKVKSGVIYKDTRNWERPSDHVPIIIDINI
jgi:exodeoxyribonuclease III